MSVTMPFADEESSWRTVFWHVTEPPVP